MGLFGSLYYVGYVIGSLTFLRLGDSKGRKWILALALAIQTVVLLLFYFVTILEVYYVLMFIQGFASCVREGLSYVFAMELIPAKH